MNHFITAIHIDQVRHVKDMDIELNPDRKMHLILTGKNGSGKTSLINAIKANLRSVSEINRLLEDSQYGMERT